MIMGRKTFLLTVVFFVLSNCISAQTDNYSWIYFYYTHTFVPHRPVFKISFNDKEAFNLEQDARVKFKIYSTGKVNVSYYNENLQLGSSVNLNVEQGKSYYLKLDNTYLKLKEVDKDTWEKEFNNNKLAVVQNLFEDVNDPFVKKDVSSVDNITSKEKKIKIVSDVDNEIPVNSEIKQNTYALIIGNEDYSSFQPDLSNEVNAEFALNDAKVFKEYCIKTLGIPEKQVKLLANATVGQMRQGIAWINNLAKIDNGKAELIFYYSGHGLPDEKTKEPYLIPVDISGSSVTLGVKLSEVYEKLTEYPSQRVIVFLDACFSGGARNQGLIAMKGVKVKPKENLIHGNMVVFASSTGDESSGVYRDKQHGYMTYFLLKKLKESKGDITFNELANYVIECVKKETALDSKIQTPQLNFSQSIENTWSDWNFK